jgi:hypothetical protein
MSWTRALRTVAAALVIAAVAAPGTAEAFCGFYVAGADARLVNNATEVVLMREGTRTVLSMQNNYQGPPQDFAMVVPVPIVLQKDNVKILPRDIFDHVEKLSAPRLVEYWEQDPCPRPRGVVEDRETIYPAPPSPTSDEGVSVRTRVKVEARFSVGEYDIVVLSAGDSMGLDAWLRENGYKIPEGSEPVLRPYVQGAMKFFVAKVDPRKVRFENGMAQLSPLRFHYDSDLFALPVRLGLLNSPGKQDLIVHVLARGSRYEVANYDNVAIPTNLDVRDTVRQGFAGFYASLFDATLRKRPGAVVTEYAWEASTCDPCPVGPLTLRDVATLGADVALGDDVTAESPDEPAVGWVLTRLHARYGKESLGEDLVFREAQAIVGGREHMKEGGKLETTARADGSNNFQARYSIRHPWTGPIECEKPRRGVWGGPPGGEVKLVAATGLAFAPRDVNLDEAVADGQVDAYALSPGGRVPTTIPIGIHRGGRGCAGCAVGEQRGGALAALALLASALGLGAGRRARRRRRGEARGAKLSVARWWVPPGSDAPRAARAACPGVGRALPASPWIPSSGCAWFTSSSRPARRARRWWVRWCTGRR